MKEPKPFDLIQGRRLGRHYRVLEFLGKGWEGEVYKVEEEQTGIIRAAKLFYQRHHIKKDPHVVYAKKLHALRNCPIIIQYHHKDFCKINNKEVGVLVSDYVDGELLSQFLARQKQHRLAPFEALHLFYSIVKGIEQIHKEGEYHGDIHSENIMVHRQGLGFHVYLIDLLHLGRSTKTRMQDDVYDLIHLLLELLGGKKYYKDIPASIRSMILGLRKQSIAAKFQKAGDLSAYLEKLEWK